MSEIQKVDYRLMQTALDLEKERSCNKEEKNYLNNTLENLYIYVDRMWVS